MHNAKVNIKRVDSRWVAELDTYYQRIFCYGTSPLNALRRLRRHSGLISYYYGLVDEAITQERRKCLLE